MGRPARPATGGVAEPYRGVGPAGRRTPTPRRNAHDTLPTRPEELAISLTTAAADRRADDLPGGLESAPADERSGRFPCVEGMRGLAALAVVLTHVGFTSGESLVRLQG